MTKQLSIRVLKPWDRCETMCWRSRKKTGDKVPCIYRARHLLKDERAVCGIHFAQNQRRKKTLTGGFARGVK